MPRLTFRSQAASMGGMRALSRREFREVVNRAVEALPPRVKVQLVNVVVDVEDEPDKETLRELGFSDAEIADGETLFGLFAPMPGFSGAIGDPHRIIIYQRSLEECFTRRDELIDEIQKTVLHELHHHFGYSERDIERWTDLE
jgi:predicted Zn-dependent protease with MMP-like domain